MKIVLLLFLAIFSYLSGSVQGSYIASRYIYKDKKAVKDWQDYKLLHSFLRERAPVIVIDGVKILIPVVLFRLLSPVLELDGAFLSLLGGTIVTLGHIFPFFKKGKGEAMEGFVITSLMTNIPSALLSIVVFLILYLVFGRKTIPFMVSVFAFPLVYILFSTPSFEAGILSILYAVLIVWRQKMAVNKFLLE